MLVKIHDAKTHLSRLIQRALDGEEIIIAKGNRPLVKLVVLDDVQPPRRLGTASGKVVIRSDFDAPIADFDGYQ
ncbi:MAG: prevent-host-death protein [Deltaproteobacteria bacterium RIFOXYA12_FULL_58_15]|nr:MAG: prevent-host-death protein [Deltaproteobacteria bacterium RIFOXYA12_FULL_58_15]OGR07446.1 MAG: prevent-host-death protein [Deltaproteobacteria bacterium RIFOXYB12_FULL_58_9]